jgi:hypothetical protein
MLHTDKDSTFQSQQTIQRLHEKAMDDKHR